MKARFLKFAASRLMGTVVDTLVLLVLTKFLFFTYAGQYLVAPAISFEVAMFHNYLLSYYFIWQKVIPLKSTRDFFIRLMSYNISALFGFSVKMGFLLLFERLFGWDVLLCNVAALLISGFVNFFLAEKIVFKKPAQVVVDDN